jgi:hypothetical protein
MTSYARQQSNGWRYPYFAGARDKKPMARLSPPAATTASAEMGTLQLTRGSKPRPSDGFQNRALPVDVPVFCFRATATLLCATNPVNGELVCSRSDFFPRSDGSVKPRRNQCCTATSFNN